jgi:hypothetical protein
VIPAGGLSPDGQRWVRPRYAFFLPVKVLSRVFRGKFVAGLKHAFHKKELLFPGSLKALEGEKPFGAFLRKLYRQDWVVYAKPPFGGPKHVLHYLARYTHRVAISNHRLIRLADGQVTFRWKDYAHGNKKRKMTVSAHEFLRRFTLHVLPKGFVRIRFFGFLAHRRRALLPHHRHHPFAEKWRAAVRLPEVCLQLENSVCSHLRRRLTTTTDRQNDTGRLRITAPATAGQRTFPSQLTHNPIQTP